MSKGSRRLGGDCEVVENGTRCPLVGAHTTEDGTVMCDKHHGRFRRHGDPLVVLRSGRPKGSANDTRIHRVRRTFAMPTSEEIAWAAGLFEGEGCFSTGPRSTPTATVGMTDFDIIHRFDAIVRVGNITGPKDRGPTRKAILIWHTGSHEALQHVICLFWPWLGERRRQRARELLADFNARRPHMVPGADVRWVHETPAWQMFGKRLKDLTPDEKRKYDLAQWQRRRDEQRATEGKVPIDEHYRQTLAFRMFGKRKRDLTPDELREYSAAQTAASRARQKASGQGEDS